MALRTELQIANAALRKLGAEEVSSLSDTSKEAQVMNSRIGPAKQAVLRDHPWNFATRRIALESRVAGTTITAITKANPAQVTSTGHGMVTGDRVEITSVGGMTEVNGYSFTITRVDDDNFTLDSTDSSAYTTYTTGGTARWRPAFDFGNWFALPTDCLRVLPITDIQYRVEGRYIATDESRLELKYIKDVDLGDNITVTATADPLFAEALSTYLAWDCCYAIAQSNTAKQIFWNDYLAILKRARFANATEGGHLQVLQPQSYIDARYSFGSSNARPFNG